MFSWLSQRTYYFCSLAKTLQFVKFPEEKIQFQKTITSAHNYRKNEFFNRFLPS